jgi:hypothetical protein
MISCDGLLVEGHAPRSPALRGPPPDRSGEGRRVSAPYQPGRKAKGSGRREGPPPTPALDRRVRRPSTNSVAQVARLLQQVRLPLPLAPGAGRSDWH